MNTLAQTQSPVTTRREGFLFGPVIDFLGLGGLSLIFLALLAVFVNPDQFTAKVSLTFIILANFVNHPHFANSYQIFYRDFRRKTGVETETILRWRYIFAGLIAPALLAGYLLYAVMTARVNWVGYSVNFMGFVVGWHYVKQGYGMLIVDSVLKRRFFSNPEKKLFTWNAYAVWIYSWMLGNAVFKQNDFMGIGHYAIGLPSLLLNIGLAAMVVSTVASLYVFYRKLGPQEKGLPVNGVMAYLTSSYIWLLVVKVNPLFVFVIPFFHSLQYITVVSRFQLNVEKEKVGKRQDASGRRDRVSSVAIRMANFYGLALLLGVLGFWIIPQSIAATTDFSLAETTPAIWIAVFWLFINIHHYFLDNVMWRKGNPEVAKHLFAYR